MTLIPFCSLLPGTANIQLDEQKKVKKTWIYLPSEYKQFKLKLHEVSNALPFLFTQTS